MVMKVIKLISVAWLLVIFPHISTAVTSIEKLDLFVGEIRVLENVDVKRVAIGKGTLIKVKTLPRSQLLIIAEKEGSTSLHLWYKDGRENDINIRISKEDPARRVRLEDTILMEVKIIEFRKSALDSLGINWQSEINGPTYGFNDLATPTTSFFGIATSITSRINFLASNGDAFTLAEPNLSCVNGGRATFLAGGQVPIPVRGSNGELAIEYKDYGIKLNISPVADESGVIAARIMTEVSQLDLSVNVLGAPGFLTRKTETEMNVRENETIVISGLLNTQNGQDASKVPLLGDIPILGHLFKSTEYRNSQTELAIFVTPRIITADSKSNLDKVKRYTKRSDGQADIVRDNLDIPLAD